jgi:flagellar hook-basal body protein
MSFYTSLTGLNSATAQLAITSNNIANVGTAGFKRSRADFGDIFSTSPLQKSSSQIGQGVSLKQVSQEFSQGNISTSGNSLDLAITGDGFFPLKTADGLQDIYTRNGSFTLNDQNNVVNSTGQRLMAASVDSSGKADLTNLNPLTIPNKTSGEARETTSIQLGLNLPADSEVINGDFDRTNPATYNKSTALTVYDSGGNGYLATVYYVKTQNASQSSPFSKWQSYFFVGDTQVKPALQQASDKTGSTLYVNKYGEVLPKSDSRVIPSSGTTEMYTLDQLTNTQTSSPASAPANAVSVNGTELAMTGATLAEGTKKLEIKFKPSATATTSETLTYTLGAGDRYPEVLARNVQDALNAKLAQLGTERATVKAVETTTGGVTTLNYEVKFSGTSVEDPTTPFSTGLKTAQTDAFGGTATKVSFQIAVDGANSPQTVEYTLTKQDKNPDILARNLEIAINNKLGSLDAASARFGVRVTFDPESAKFSFASGTTGDGSSLIISEADAAATTYLGLPNKADTDLTKRQLQVLASTDEALRGKSSLAAVLTGEPMTINTTKSIAVGSGNKDFFVSVDGISGKIEVPPQTYNNMDKFAEALQTQINSMADTETGRQVSGVTVKFDPVLKRLTFTTGTNGDNSSIQITGSSDWGLANTEMQFGQTTNWIKLQQYTENGAPQYVKNGVQTEDATGLSSKTEWWPVYLDRGELSFDLTGKPVSPLTAMPFETAFLDGGKGALTMSIDFTRSTQYSSAFAVLSQSQDGAPEGDLMGLDIGVDGLVNATYSNGSQVSLGKIVLANFSSPTGLRQIGDASYLASATSGNAKIGEAGSAGFGSIRAGATERANVDLTQELVDLITAQRNFQANAKSIETSSTMTQAIINIRA